jgi:hypothetical protein
MVIQRPKGRGQNPAYRPAGAFLFFKGKSPKAFNFRAKVFLQHLVLLRFFCRQLRAINRPARDRRRNDLLRRYGALSNLH